MISKFVSKNQKDWDLYLPYLMMAYRSSVHDTMGEKLWGWYGLFLVLLMCNLLHISVNMLDVNCAPWSVCIWMGRPTRQINSVNNLSATVVASISGRLYASANLVK
jgi:hypothetical protein